MSVRIIYDSRHSYAAIYCSTTMWAFGPVFTGPDADSDAQEFLRWLPRDAREYSESELEKAYGNWRIIKE